MGYIKGRFCSLRGLRQQIDNAQDHERAIIWVKACIIIHTLIFSIEKGAEDPSFVEDLIEEGREGAVSDALGDDDVRESTRETRGKRLREQLKKNLFDYLYN